MVLYDFHNIIYKFKFLPLKIKFKNSNKINEYQNQRRMHTNLQLKGKSLLVRYRITRY